MNTTLERIEDLLKQKGQSIPAMCATLGIPKSTYYTWKRLNKIPDSKHLLSIAVFLKTTTDHLLGKDDSTLDGYYMDPVTIEIANKIKDNPGQKVLFDATKDLAPEDVFEVLNFINQQNKKEGR